ncbi:hypothetical protein BS78_01G298800 [Paspalum vaginatum]|nr:hypothetical protein BS78_01G298800 [Paspalum vaginatum]
MVYSQDCCYLSIPCLPSNGWGIRTCSSVLNDYWSLRHGAREEVSLPPPPPTCRRLRPLSSAASAAGIASGRVTLVMAFLSSLYVASRFWQDAQIRAILSGLLEKSSDKAPPTWTLAGKNWPCCSQRGPVILDFCNRTGSSGDVRYRGTKVKESRKRSPTSSPSGTTCEIAQQDIPVLGRRLIQNSATEAEGHAVLNGRPSQALQAHPLPGYNNSSFGFRETRLDWPYGNLEQKVQLHSKPNIVNGLLH